jgi:hypothetical protein
MNKIVLTVIGFVLLFSASCSKLFGPQLCSDNTALALGQAYYLAMPIWEIPGMQQPETLSNFIKRVGQRHFSANGVVVQCAKALGEFMIARGISAYDPKAYDRAMAVAPAGAGQLAPDVARSFNSGSVDAIAMGQELVWLSQVLPQVAKGDLTAFNNSGTQARQTVRQALPMLKLMLANDPQMTRTVKTVLSSYSNTFSQISRDQVLMMARIYRAS